MAGKTFRFSLQRVLDLRHHEAEEAERARQAVQAATPEMLSYRR